MNNDYSAVIHLLREMRLSAMADHLLLLIESNEITTISKQDLLVQLVSQEYTSRTNNTIARYLKNARLSQPSARLTEINYAPERKINAAVIDQLSSNDYITKGRSVIIMGACGTGKSYLCNALAVNACESKYTALYCRMFELIGDLNQQELLGVDQKTSLKKYLKPDILIIDDFLISSINEKEATNLYKILEYRHGIKSTIIGSQLEPKEWHNRLGGTIMADSILDRLIPNSYKIILSGESLRKQ